MRPEWKKQRWKRTVDADTAKEMNRGLITQDDEEHLKAFRAYAKNKVKP